jgi:hypothetical protein
MTLEKNRDLSIGGSLKDDVSQVLSVYFMPIVAVGTAFGRAVKVIHHKESGKRPSAGSGKASPPVGFRK